MLIYGCSYQFTFTILQIFLDIELHYLLELKDSEDFTISEIVNEITNRNFDSAFINLYSPFISNPENGGVNQFLEAPKQMEEIIKVSYLYFLFCYFDMIIRTLFITICTF